MPHTSAREIARQHGDKLPSFPSRQEAEQHWFALRDKHLALLAQIALGDPELDLDYTPSSLKQLERWYLQVHADDSFQSIGTSPEAFEICMAVYFGETVVRNTTARWIVEEYFLAPGKYELGIARDGLKMMLHRFTDHFQRPGNKRQQSLYRLYNRYFG